MFDTQRQHVTRRLAELATRGALFRTDPDRDLIWQLYLGAIPEEFRQSNNCNCCKSFLRQFGGIVAIGPDCQVETLWDFDASGDPEYAVATDAVRHYIRSLPIVGPFLNSFAKIGTEKSPDPKRNVVWTHYHATLPAQFVRPDDQIGPYHSSLTATKEVLERGLTEITCDAAQTVLELIDQGSLYRGAEFRVLVAAFIDLQARYRLVPAGLRSNWAWREAADASKSQTVMRVKNTVIGELLIDLSEGKKSLDAAVSAFERMVAPANYKRPTTLATPRMIEAAKERLTELGLLGSLNRRLLSERDLSVNNTLFVHRPVAKQNDVFAELTNEAKVNPKSFAKVDEVSLADFLGKVLPTASSVKVLLENHHLGNFVSLVGPINQDDPSMFKWAGNNVSWSYTGAVTDSTKERVKKAGGKVDGLIRVSLSWSNYDDLDLHIIEPTGREIYYRDKRGASGGLLDVDMNAGCGATRGPVENICWASWPTQEGLYRVCVDNFYRREAAGSGFEVELEVDGELYTFSRPDNRGTGARHEMFQFTYNRKDGVRLIGEQADAKVGAYRSQTKWGLQTGQFHQVRAITFSPNYWADQTGNRHVFFLLDKCVSDEPTRGFYNEFLRSDLDADRKVFEMLAGKVSVESVPAELSGVGFSETIRSSMIVEVEGAFKRVIKVKF